MPGTTSYPAALDTFPNIAATTPEDATGYEHDVMHNNAAGAIEALQAKVGVDGSAVAGSVDYKLAALAAADSALAPLASPALTGTPTAPTAAPGTSTTQIATTAFAAAAIAMAVTGVWDFKTGIDCSASPNYPAAIQGDAHAVTVAGKVGGASGLSVDIGDMIVASADNAGGTQAGVGTSWLIFEHNLIGALLSANNLSDLASAATARANLGLGSAATHATTDYDAAGAATAVAAAITTLFNRIYLGAF
jgi:hypothetical protein